MIPSRLKTASLMAAGLALLLGCGSDTQELEMSNLIKSQFQKRTSKADVAASQAAVLKVRQADVNATPLPLLRVRIEGTGALATLVEVDRKGPNASFQAADGGSFTFRGGILTGSRGLGQDLMSLAGPSLAQAARKGSYTKVYRYLDGDEVLIPLTVSCQMETSYFGRLDILAISYDVEEFSEVCRGSDPTHGSLEFQNYYWRDLNSGQIVQSRQFISPKFGRLEVERLNRQ